MYLTYYVRLAGIRDVIDYSNARCGKVHSNIWRLLEDMNLAFKAVGLALETPNFGKFFFFVWKV